jgi:dihydrofolate reductase
MNNRKVLLYICMSLDGFIATKDDGLDWLSVVEKEGEDYGYHKTHDNTDTYIVGRKTYDTVLKLTGGDFPPSKQYKCYVITRQNKADEDGITFYNGDVQALIAQLKNEEGKNIYCDGGAQIVKILMDKNLIDEYIISIIPIILGDGKRLFAGETPMINLKAVSSQQYDTGLVQLRYVVLNNTVNNTL